MADSAAAPALAASPVLTAPVATTQTPSTSWSTFPATWSVMPAAARQTTAAAPSASAPGAPVWVVVHVDGPPMVAPGEAMTVTATVTNVSGETARGLLAPTARRTG